MSTNMAVNPGLESSTTGWGVRWYGTTGAGTADRSTTAAHSGVYGYRKTWTAAAGSSSSDTGLSYGYHPTGGYSSDLLAIVAGQAYRLGMWLRSSRATTVRAVVLWYSDAGAQVGTTYVGPSVAAPAGTWVEVSATLTVPAGATRVLLIGGPRYVDPATAPAQWLAGDTLDADDASVAVVTGTILSATPDPAAAAVLLQVTGAPQVQPSSYTEAVQSFETDAGGWSVLSGNVTAAREAVSYPAARTGAYALAVRYAGVTSYPGPTVGRTVTGLTVGARYRATAYVTVGAGSGWQVALGVVPSAGPGFGPAGDYSTAEGVSQLITYEWTATATSHQLQLRPRLATTTPAVVWVDDVQVTAVLPGQLGITRSDANGVQAVRLYAGQRPIGGALTVQDREPALSGPVVYTVTDELGGTATATVPDLGATGPWLGVPVLPGLSRPVARVVELTARREATGTVHQVVLRADPVATTGPLGLRRGRLELWAPDHAGAQDLVDAYAAGEVVQLRTPDHARLDCYHVPVAVDTSSDATGWRVQVDYVELAWPAGPLLGGAGWSFADASSRYGSFAALASAWASFHTLAAG